MDPLSLDISVVICTYSFERFSDLLAAVQSVRNQSARPGEIIIVVDHNPGLFEKIRAEVPHAVVVENKGLQGLSGARNTGLALAKGQLLAFFDDDEILQPDCLQRLQEWCRQPGVLGAGGRIVPNWLAARPGWFPEEFGWVLGYSYKGLPSSAAPVRNLIGGSMCFQRRVFEEIGGFRDGLGRINKRPLGCEETELCIRLLQHWPDGRLMYEPEAVVLHQTPPARANWKYFRERCFYEGISKAAISKFVGANDSLSSEKAYSLRVLPLGFLGGIRDFLSRRDRNGLARAAAILLGLACTGAGYIFGSFQSRGARARTGLERDAVKEAA